MSGVDLTNHFSLNSSADVSFLCQPLRKLNISYFNYVKIFPDGSRAVLCNNAIWIKHFYQHGLYTTPAVTDIDLVYPQGVYHWKELNTDDQAYVHAKEYYNIDNGITFVTKQNNTTLLYIFASSRGNTEANDFYYSNQDILKRFIFYFSDSGKQLVDVASKNKIRIPNKQIVTDKEEIPYNPYYNLRNDFFKTTNIRKFYLLDYSEDVYFTKQEAVCATHIAEGLTAKQIAQLLDVSFRTIETHIEHIKNKMMQATKAKLKPNKQDIANFIKKLGIPDLVFV